MSHEYYYGLVYVIRSPWVLRVMMVAARNVHDGSHHISSESLHEPTAKAVLREADGSETARGQWAGHATCRLQSRIAPS